MARKKAKASLAKMPVRNPIAANPLLSKSVVHEKSAKARRGREKAKLKKEWYPQITVVAGCDLSMPFVGRCPTSVPVVSPTQGLEA